VKVITTLWSLTGSRVYPTKEGIKDVTKTAEIKPFKAPPEKPLSSTMPKAVIGSALVRVGEYLIGFVYLLEFRKAFFISSSVAFLATPRIS